MLRVADFRQIETLMLVLKSTEIVVALFPGAATSKYTRESVSV
jgi:hypothetical protein